MILSKLLMSSFVLAFATISISTAAHADEDHDDSSSSIAIKSSTISDAGETDLHKGPVEYGALFTLETLRSFDKEVSNPYSGWYVFKPTVKYNPLKMTFSAQGSYWQPYASANAASEGSPSDVKGSMDNPLFTLTKSWEEGTDFKSPVFDTISIGVTGSTAANQETRDLGYRNSAGPYAKIDKKWGKFSVGETSMYQHRFYTDATSDDAIQFAEAFKSLSEVAYQFTENFDLSAGITFIHGTSLTGEIENGNRSIFSADYKINEKLSTSLGWMIERGLSTLEGLSEKLVSNQAFFDLNLEI